MSYMNIPFAHVQQMKRILLVPTTARHRGATRELQVHLHYKQSLLNHYTFHHILFSRHIFVKEKLTLGIREHVVYTGIP